MADFKLRKIIGRSQWFVLVLFAVLLACVAGRFTTASDAVAITGRPPGSPSNPLDRSAKPAIGSVNGIKLSIPNYYLLSGVQYKGEEPLSQERRSVSPTLETPIESFAILLRLSNLQPIRTAQDQEDRRQSEQTARPFIAETWTMIGFYPKLYLENDGSLKPAYDNWVKDHGYWGPFVEKEPIFGLNHMISVQSIDNGSNNHGQFEFFFDRGNWTTFIYCETQRARITPFDTVTHCTDMFVLPDLKVVAEADMTKKDLYRWREINQTVDNIAKSFIVR